uniref:CHCH domain-containing protein n=1 Tax=Amphilophus citrinellus TaxID=61819 RepID=A0A3Q0R608_AMPCI
SILPVGHAQNSSPGQMPESPQLGPFSVDDTLRESMAKLIIFSTVLYLQVQKLQKKDSQLKALEAFYKEQLAQLEKRNLERYQQSKEQFHQAASKTEETVRARSTAAVCPGLQAQILSCYRDNKDQTLKCSDLAKEYMKCINAAKKVRAFNKSWKATMASIRGDVNS